MIRMQHRQTGRAVQAHLFTGKDPNRQPTRDFVGRTIVIRQGKFLHDIGYVHAGEWLIKYDDNGSFEKYTPSDLHKYFRFV